MATKNIVPRADGEGELGTSSKKWSKVQAVTGSFDHIQTTTMTSEIYSEGSTKFGDSTDDTHIFTGSAAVYSDNGMTLQATSSTPSGSAIQHDFLTVADSSGGASANFFYRTENPFSAPPTVLLKTLEFSGSTGTDVNIAAGSPDPTWGTGGSLRLYGNSLMAMGDSDVQIDSGQDLYFNAGTEMNLAAGGDIGVYSQGTARLSGSGALIRVGTGVQAEAQYLLVQGTDVSWDDVLYYASPSSYGTTHFRYLSYGYDNTYDCAKFTAGYGGAGGDNQFIWYVSNDTDSEHPVMFLDFSGNLGIGTTTPAKTLDVVGNVSASQEISASSFWGDGSNLSGITAATASNADKIDVYENPAGSANFRVAFVDNVGSGYEQVYVDTGLLYNPNTEIFKVTDVEVTNAVTASGIHSGPLHIHGSSVHSGTIDMYAGGGLYFFGEDGSQSGSLTNTPGGLLLTPDAAGKIAVAGVLSASLNISASAFYGDGQYLDNVATDTELGTLQTTVTTNTSDIATNTSDIGNNTTAIGDNTTTINNLDLDAITTVGNTTANSIEVTNLTASAHVSASVFYGDGSGLTGVTGDWDGQHTGDAGITGSLEVLGNLSASLDISAPNITASVYLGNFLSRINFEDPDTAIWAKNTGQDLYLEGGRDVYIRPDGDVKIYTGTGSGTKWVEFDGPNQKVEVTGDISASINISASGFYGDGSGLTGVTGDWDGQHTGDAGITGSLEVTQNITASAIQITTDGNPAIVDANGNAKMQFDSDEIYFYADDPAEAALLIATNMVDVSPNADLDFRVGGSSNKLFVDVSEDLVVANGDLDISGSTEFGNLSTDTHQFTGSVNISGALYAGTENPEEQHRIIGTLTVDAAGVNNSELIVDGPNPNYIVLKRDGKIAGQINTGGNAFTFYGGNSISGNNGIAGQFLYDTSLSTGITHFKDTATENFAGNDCKVNISASSRAFRIDTDTADEIFMVEDATTSFVSGSGDLLTMDDTTTPATPVGGAHLYAITGSMYVMDTGGNETQISPHDEDGEWQYFSRNTRTGKVVRIRMEKMIRKLEEITGETFIEEE